MRGARKIARQKSILLDDNDLGNFINLELYEPQTWVDLTEDNSLATTKISIGNIHNIFKKNNLKTPRSIRFKNDKETFSHFFLANVSPAGIGTNILGRRWFDQYISAGRNVDDQVYYVAFSGNNWIDFETRIGKLIEKNNLILQLNFIQWKLS